MSQQEFVLILFQVVVLVLAFSVHESAHAYAAMRLGDPTAYMLGRVTLNPMKHLDPLGSVLVPLVSLVYGGWLIGWAKPCPVTTRNFRHLRRDDILACVPGTSNVLLFHTDLMGTFGTVSLNPQVEQTAYGVFSDLVDLAGSFGG